ncbi:MAG: D-alanyl-D-alanine carboxypeptidase, partial [Gemmatimonadales bacterium]
MKMRLAPAIAIAAMQACQPAGRMAGGPSPVMTRAVLRASIDSLLADPMWRNAHMGILVVEPAAGDTLYSHNAGKLFMPASNEKLLSGSTALVQLGAGYRFSTVFLSSAPIAGSVLQGNLIVAGRGDPSVSDAMMGDAMKPLRAAADSLWALGIHEIAGSLVKGGNAFPDTTIGDWGWGDLDTPSGAAVDELFFNNGVARVTVYGGNYAGDPVRVRSAPALTVPTLIPELTTAEAPAATANGNGRGGRGG